MKANELRIGNIFDCYAVRITASAIDMEYVSDQKECGMFYIKDIKPIPLTERWVNNVKINWLSKDIGGYFIWLQGAKKYIKHVHTLQNWYFLIEGKELTK